MSKNGEVRVGTSGWHYKHWKGPFYPETMPPAAYLQFYLERLDTVEINNSFYMQPQKESVAAWASQVPGDFLFAYKAHRFITHMKKLKDPEDPLGRLYDVVSELGEKAGVILFQLPPSWKLNVERLEHFLQHLSKDYRHAFEFRNHTWLTGEVYDLLAAHGQAFCIYDIGGFVSPSIVTSDLVYIRLHGPEVEKYRGRYSSETLAYWAKEARRWAAEGRDVLLYFDNDEAGHAAFNAIELREMVSKGDDLLA